MPTPRGNEKDESDTDEDSEGSSEHEDEMLFYLSHDVAVRDKVEEMNKRMTQNMLRPSGVGNGLH